MNFSDEEIKRHIRLGEDNHWEFKEIVFARNVPKSPRRDDLADELAAFANTDGCVLLCGVTDSGDFQGMSREQMDALEQLLTEVCTDKVKPPIRPIIVRREIEAGKPFLLVQVERGDTHDRMDVCQSTRNEALASMLGRISVGDIQGAGERQFFISPHRCDR